MSAIHEDLAEPVDRQRDGSGSGLPHQASCDYGSVLEPGLDEISEYWASGQELEIVTEQDDAVKARDECEEGPLELMVY